MVGVKKKHSANGWDFSCFAAHVIEQDLRFSSLVRNEANRF
jgi:hypothetical protein